MKKIYAFMAVASLALSASAAPHFSDLFAKAAEGKVNTPAVQTVNAIDGSAMELKMNTVKNQIKTHRSSRAEETTCPEIAPLQRMTAVYNGEDVIRNYFDVEQTGDTTVTVTGWFDIFSDIDAEVLTANYKVVTYVLQDGSTIDFPTLTFPNGTVVFKGVRFTGDTKDNELNLWYYDAEKSTVYTGMDVEFLVDDLGNLIPAYDGLGYYLGYKTDNNKVRGMSFDDCDFTGIRGIQEAKIAALNGDSNGFDFTNAGIDEETYEEYPYSWYINYACIEEEGETNVYISNFGFSEFVTPVTLEGEDAFVNGAYYMYELVNTSTGEPVDTAFMVTGTLDGLDFEAIGGGCVGLIDYSVADTAVITIEGIWGGVTNEEGFGLMPVEIGEGLYSFFKDSKIELWGFNKPASGITAVNKEENTNAPVEYYNLQGMKVANPTPGQVVIKKQGTKTTKIFVR